MLQLNNKKIKINQKSDELPATREISIDFIS